MAKKTNLVIDCTQKRRIRETYGSLNVHTGILTIDDSTATWVVRACGVPLFTDEERKRGTCSACASGWTSPGSVPVAADAPTSFG